MRLGQVIVQFYLGVYISDYTLIQVIHIQLLLHNTTNIVLFCLHFMNFKESDNDGNKNC